MVYFKSTNIFANFMYRIITREPYRLLSCELKWRFLNRGNTCITHVYDPTPIDQHITTEAAATQYTQA